MRILEAVKPIFTHLANSSPPDLVRWGVVGLCLCCAAPAEAKVIADAVEYRDGDTTLEGYIAFDDASLGKRPGVLVIHGREGLTSHEKARAVKLAELGYVAFAVDIFGKESEPQAEPDAVRRSEFFENKRLLMRDRALAGLELLQKHPLTDLERVGAAGFGFGGTVALELARSGADLKGVVSFHGGLKTPHPEDAHAIKGKVLVLQGSDDPLVSESELEAFHHEMENAGVDWEIITYEGVVGGFTDPKAGDVPSKGVAYDEEADIRSWMAMRRFFGNVF